MVGTPNVWWVWSGGAPPTAWTTSEEDLYSEREVGEIGPGTPVPGGVIHTQYITFHTHNLVDIQCTCHEPIPDHSILQ